MSITDGANYLSRETITSRSIKIITSNTPDPAKFRVTVVGDFLRNQRTADLPHAGQRSRVPDPVKPPSAVCALLKQGPAVCVAKDESRFELNCALPEGLGPGSYGLRVCYRAAVLAQTSIHVGLARFSIFGRPPAAGLLLDCKHRRGLPGFLCQTARAGLDGSVSEMGMVMAMHLLPFNNKSFAAIVCDWDVSGPGALDLAKELARLLKPNGMICLDSRTKAAHASARGAGSLIAAPFRFTRDLGAASWDRPYGSKMLLRRLAISNFLLRLAGQSMRNRLGYGGKAFFFGDGWLESVCRSRINTCVRCWRSYHGSELLRAGVVVSIWILSFYQCPECGTMNIRTRD